MIRNSMRIKRNFADRARLFGPQQSSMSKDQAEPTQRDSSAPAGYTLEQSCLERTDHV